MVSDRRPLQELVEIRGPLCPEDKEISEVECRGGKKIGRRFGLAVGASQIQDPRGARTRAELRFRGAR